MYTISCETHFDAAHFLVNYHGKCKNIHGHRWRVCAYVSSETLIESGEFRGMVMDFNDIKPILNQIADSLDHKLVIEKDSLRSATMLMLEEEEFEIVELNFRPTAENFAKYVFDKLKENGVNPSKVRVYEAETSYAEYSED